MPAHTAQQRWNQLHNKRQGMLRRFEQYASVTIPKVLLPDGVDEFTTSIQHDWTSFGAQAVNHLTNKIVLNLFRPGVPFFRLEPSRAAALEFKARGITDEDLRESLVSGERDAMTIMDQRPIRPRLNEAVRALITVGNVLLDREEPNLPRVIGINNYVVKRSMKGRLVEVIIHEKVLYNELDAETQVHAPVDRTRDDEFAAVDYYRWYRWGADKQWTYTQHVNQHQLPDSYSKTYKEDRLPVHALTWDLADGHDYGTGMVEDYAGDFSTLSTLSEAEIKAAILASDYRWLANPAGIGDIQDVKDSITGDVIAGSPEDLQLIALGKGDAVVATAASADRVIRRLGTAFLMGSAVTRQAERVTAEEIRMQAMELETSLGGVYSRLAQDLQVPIAHWLLAEIDVEIRGTQLVPTIVTGLAALSRNAEAQQVGMFLSSLGQIASLPPEVLARLQLSNVISVMASAQGLIASEFVKPEEQVAQEQQAAQQAATEQQVRMDAAKEGAKALSQQGVQ